ncbi:unnamed protein product [Rhodiola kirilowii]
MAERVVILLILAFLAPILTLASSSLHQDDQPVLLTTNESALEAASHDFGLQTQIKPKAVLYPASVKDIALLVKQANKGSGSFFVSARGRGHSVNGQTMTSKGVVVDMTRTYNKILNESDKYWPKVNVEGKYVDVWGGELWIDVLLATLKFGLAPKTWTDYLYLTVGGTLSNAGMSGHTYNNGPQIVNVLELEVVTGKGEIVTCSREKNSELFYGVLGGLGQFGIITRARIPLEPAPERVKYIIVQYTDFSKFSKDQEYLISLHDKPSAERFDYVGGFVTYNNSASDGSSGAVYNLEVARNYVKSSANSINQEVEALLKNLEYIPNSESRKDLTYVEFLDRIHTNELVLRAEGQWVVPHPHLNLFIPKSKMAEFDQAVFNGVLKNNTNGGDILIYAVNRDKWEHEMSAVTPDADVFYAVSFLWSATNSTSDEPNSVKYLTKINNQILHFLKKGQINAKEYLPYYTSVEDWKAHFGPKKWDQFNKRKLQFDPKHILASGQHIFNAVSFIKKEGQLDGEWLI